MGESKLPDTFLSCHLLILSKIFIIEGLMTVFFGLIALIFTPNFPEKAQSWLLKPEERDYLIAKLEHSRGLEDKGSAIDEVSICKVGRL